jgi:hypothetical protein
MMLSFLASSAHKTLNNPVASASVTYKFVLHQRFDTYSH